MNWRERVRIYLVMREFNNPWYLAAYRQLMHWMGWRRQYVSRNKGFGMPPQDRK